MKPYYIFLLCLLQFSQLYATDLLKNIDDTLYCFCYKNKIYLEDKNPDNFCKCFSSFLLSTQSANTLAPLIDSKNKNDKDILLYLYWQSALICSSHPNSSELAYEIVKDYCLFHIKSYKSVCVCKSNISKKIFRK